MSGSSLPSSGWDFMTKISKQTYTADECIRIGDAEQDLSEAYAAVGDYHRKGIHATSARWWYAEAKRIEEEAKGKK